MTRSDTDLAKELRLRIDYQTAHFLRSQKDQGIPGGAPEALFTALRAAVQKEAANGLAVRMKVIADGDEPGQLLSYQLTRNIAGVAKEVFDAHGISIPEEARTDFAAAVDRLTAEALDERDRPAASPLPEPTMLPAAVLEPRMPKAPQLQLSARKPILSPDQRLLAEVLPLADRFMAQSMAPNVYDFAATAQECRHLVATHALGRAFNQALVHAGATPSSAEGENALAASLDALLERHECREDREASRQLAASVDSIVDAAVAQAVPPVAQASHAARLAGRSDAGRTL